MEPSPLPAGLRTVLIMAAAVLALVGAGGLATGAADGDDLTTAGSNTTTSLRDTDSVLGVGDGSDAAATTTVAGATATTAKGSTATTARPGAGTATTVAAVESNACAAPPDTGSNPGAIVAPVVGIYTYVSCDDATQSQDTAVRPGNDADGKVRRQISANFGGFEGTATTAFGGGVTQEVLTIQAFGSTLVCDWNPDIVQYPAALSVGASWATKSSCTAGGVKITFDGTGKVSGRKAVTVGGTTVNTWVVETKVTFSAPPQGSGTLTTTQYFDPSRGMDLYIKSTAEDGEGESVTSTLRLANLTPRAL